MMYKEGYKAAYENIEKLQNIKLNLLNINNKNIKLSRIESDSTINTGSWYHVAIVRCGLNHTMYVNGVAQTQKYVYHLQYSGTNMTVTIGQRQGYSAQSWDGHISNFNYHIFCKLHQMN